MRARAVAGTALAAALSGCSVNPGDVNVTPACSGRAHASSSLPILFAQSVPTASLIPCVELLPVGWQITTVDARSGAATFTLASDREGQRAVTVELARDCDLDGAVGVPSDQAGTRRFERPRRVTAGYAGDRIYVFSGGCATYRFDLHGSSGAVAVNEASLALGFMTRDAVADEVRERTNGRLHLDPPTQAKG